MSYKREERKVSYRSKFEDEFRPAKRSAYNFDESRIDFRTEIPQLPANPKAKPNEHKHKDKVEDLEKRIKQAKQQRRLKKEVLKKGSHDFDQEISKLTRNVELGKKCLIVLKHDIEDIDANLLDIDDKIERKTKYIRNLLRGPRDNRPSNKTYEEMTYEELEFEQNRLSIRVSTATLSKREESDLNNLISKLARLKMTAAHGEKPKDNTAAIENAQDTIQRLKNAQENLESERVEILNKIECIEEQIEEFDEQREDLEEQKKNPENEEIAEESKKLKEEIYKLRDELAKLEEEYDTKKKQYQEEQDLIKWVKWASEIQRKKNQEWEAQREERRRQRLKEKEKEKEKAAEGKTDGKEGENKEEDKPEKKRINKHQKEIDACSFLLTYCDSLITKQENGSKQTEKKTTPNVEIQLKSGDFKNLEVIKSKKLNVDQESVPKSEKYKKKKTEKNKEQEPDAPKTFNHQVFTLHVFDSVRVVAPTKAEEVEATIKQLNDKLAYFLEHPEGSYENDRKDRFERETRERPDRNRYTEKGTKTKPESKTSHINQKSVINTTDFPSLE